MKKTLAAFIAVSCAVTAFTAHSAADNTVRFIGEVANQTCSLDINGTDKSPVVLLPTVPVKDFNNTVGTTTGDTEFTINISGCTATTEAGMEKTLSIAFVGNSVTTSKNLGNTGDADGVSIQLVDNNAVNLEFTPGDLIKSSQKITIADDGSVAPVNFVARYYAEKSAVTAGSVIASAQYAITYK
ncbi:type 1 fimbrial protein [Morganella morganii]|uniref:fimbrial protein n=1 Tax=Morganella morganii TaxID=582 RepID=UPI00339BE336